MSRDVGLYIHAQDNFSNSLKNMSKSAVELKNNAASLKAQLDVLNASRASLKVDVSAAKRALDESKKAFLENGDAASRARYEADQLNYDALSDSLKDVTRDASAANRELRGIEDTLSRGDNRASSGGGSSALSKLGAAGFTKMLGDVASEAADAIAGSALGSEGGGVFSSLLSGAASGAALGTLGGPLGTAVGAGVGALAGAARGAVQIFSARDEAFKTVVQESYQSATEAQTAALEAGSALAGKRETGLISWTTLIGDAGKAKAFTGELKDMANVTPFLYDDLNAMAKALKTFGYSEEELLPTLTAIGDTGATLGMSTSDMTTVATALGRMRVTDKTTTEYLNLLLERGIPAYDYLATSMGTTKQEVIDMISRGLIPGGEAAQAIADAMGEANKGGMELQSKTFEGLSSTVEGLTNELNAAMGAGYNETRKGGLAEQVDFLGGETGTQMQQAYEMIGTWKATLDNSKDELQRSVVGAVMGGDISEEISAGAAAQIRTMQAEYAKAAEDYASGDESAGAVMGRIMAEAQVLANNEYLASEGYDLELQGQLDLIAGIQSDTALSGEYWDAGYKMGQSFSRGVLSGSRTVKLPTAGDLMQYEQSPGTTYGDAAKPNAWGLERVPYDNYPALLHEGERVLTGSEARGATGGANIVISGNTFTVREDADIERIAQELAEQIRLARMVV